MRNRRDFLTGAGSVAIALAAVGWTRPAWPQACSICKTTSLLLPLSGALFLPPNPCVPAGENVSIAGDVHVVTKVRSNQLFDAYLNMAGVDGMGQTSGSLYIGTGSNKFIGVQWPPDPITPATIVAIFSLEATNGCASVGLPVTFHLLFGSDGALLVDSTMSVGGCFPPECS
jgi:hypothetical protein